MKKITIDLNLDDAAWEVIETRAKRAVEAFRKEAEEIGVEFTIEEAVKNELQYIIDKDIETYDVYDEVRHSDEVQSAIRREIRKAASQDLKTMNSEEKEDKNG